jgi:D-alanine-D-alanine ligase
MKKLRVGVVYGGRSGEHEVSIASAAAVLKHLDRSRYEAVPIRIEKDGRWSLADRMPTAVSAAEVIEQARVHGRPARIGRETLPVARPGGDALITIERSAPNHEASAEDSAIVAGVGLDVIFPVLHGPYGEDGTIQGLFELANVPYVGAGVLGSAAGMDKATMKILFAARGLPVVPWMTIVAHEWRRERGRVIAAALRLGLPLFVKPANLGSSVGISKVKAEDALAPAIEDALAYDRKIVIEAGVPDAREIECGVIGNDEPSASVAGEIVPSREFYDYEAKYLDEGSQTIIPANLDPALMADIQRLSIEAFRAIDGAGMARVDFLLSRHTGALYVSEVNTIPGFTAISMFAKLWQASGVSFAALVDRLIQLAIERHAEKQRLRTSVT